MVRWTGHRMMFKPNGLSLRISLHNSHTDAVNRLRASGLWEPLCETCLWQPVCQHSDASALSTILNHLVEPAHRPKEIRNAMIAILGKELMGRIVLEAGPSEINFDAWHIWHRLLGLDNAQPHLKREDFADGWAMRCQGDTNRVSHEDVPYPTYPDENVIWVCDTSGEYHPIPI